MSNLYNRGNPIRGSGAEVFKTKLEGTTLSRGWEFSEEKGVKRGSQEVAFISKKRGGKGISKTGGLALWVRRGDSTMGSDTGPRLEERG